MEFFMLCDLKSQIFSVYHSTEHLFGNFESHKQMLSDLHSPQHQVGVFKTKMQKLGDLHFPKSAR